MVHGGQNCSDRDDVMCDRLKAHARSLAGRFQIQSAPIPTRERINRSVRAEVIFVTGTRKPAPSL
jgi:hypothetical protein